MVEPAGAIGATAIVLTVGRKVFGKTLDQMGTDLVRLYSAYCTANIARMVEKAEKRRMAREGSEAPDGDAIHPRVARAILEEGAWVSDDVQQEYMAGLLLSARSDEGDDDSVAYYANIAARLTSDQVRLHHLIYSALERRIDLSVGDPPLFQNGTYDRLSVMTDWTDFYETFQSTENATISNAIYGLKREGLLASYATSAPTEDHPAGYAYFPPTPLGATLYSFARGLRPHGPDEFMDEDTRLDDFDPEPPRLQRATIGRWNHLAKAPVPDAPSEP